MSTTLFAQFSGSAHDRIIRKIADQMNTHQYEAALSTLEQLEGQNRQATIDERFYYFSIKSRYQLLLEDSNISYGNMVTIRQLSQRYLEKFKTNKFAKLAEVADIYQDMLHHYPMTILAYHDWQDEQKRLIFERKQKDALVLVEKAYQSNQYELVLSQIVQGRKQGISSSGFDYYEILAKNEIFLLSHTKDFRAVEEIVRLGEIYLHRHKSVEKDHNTIEEIVQKYPKTLEGFNAMLESERLANLENTRREKLGKLHIDYNKGDYSLVMQATNTFDLKSDMGASFTYLQAMSGYKDLLRKKDPYYSQIVVTDIRNVRMALLAYQEMYGNTQPENRKQVNGALADLNNVFGSNDHQFDRLKQNALAQREKAIKRSRRSMFVSVGYEYGEIAPYGLRFEVGGRAIGFFTTARSSLINERDLFNNNIDIANKNEVIVGPNIRMADWLFWNVGAGYGYFSHIYRNDYTHTQGIMRSDYIAGYTGFTLRAGSVVNFIVGASFMDISKKYSNQLAKPEYTLGMAFNFK